MSAARTKSMKKKKRTHRYTSNVFSMFNQAQIQEFKEAFNMIDQNRDGFIDKDDLIEMLTSLGKNPEDQLLDNMINEAPGAINFTMFLTLFGEKLNGTDPEDVIRNAFGCFDVKDIGVLKQDYFREIMTTMGDRWTDDMVDELLYGAPIKEGVFDYIEFTRMLKHGARDKDDEPMEAPQSMVTTPKPTTPKPTPSQKPQPSKFNFQSGGEAAEKSKGKGVARQKSGGGDAGQQGSPSPAAAPKPFWKKPKPKSPPPSNRKSPPPPTKPKSPSTSETKLQMKPGTQAKPDLPSGGKPELPVLKSTLKMGPFGGGGGAVGAKSPQPGLKPVLKPAHKK